MVFCEKVYSSTIISDNLKIMEAFNKQFQSNLPLIVLIIGFNVVDIRIGACRFLGSEIFLANLVGSLVGPLRCLSAFLIVLPSAFDTIRADMPLGTTPVGELLLRLAVLLPKFLAVLPLTLLTIRLVPPKPL